MTAFDRMDCGWYGITAQQCAERDCCWEESVIPGAPWCFHTLSKVIFLQPMSTDGVRVLVLCLCVCPSVSLSCPNKWTYKLETYHPSRHGPDFHRSQSQITMNRLAVYSYLTRYPYGHTGSGRLFTVPLLARSLEWL